MSKSHEKIKGMMNRKAKADAVSIKSSGDGVSRHAKRREYEHIVKRAGSNCFLVTTHEELAEGADHSKSHSGNTLKSLAKDGLVFKRSIYGWTIKNGQRIWGVTGLKILLPRMRQWLRAALNKASDLTSQNDAQLLVEENTETKIAKCIKMFRTYSWVDGQTGEIKLMSDPELVRTMGEIPQ